MQPDLRRALGSYWQIEMASGYSAFLDTGYQRALGQDASTTPIVEPTVPALLDGRNRVLDVLAAPYVITRASEESLRWLTRRFFGDGGPTYASGTPIDELFVLLRRRTLPRLRGVVRVDEVATRDEAIGMVQRGKIDPSRVALVEQPFAQAGAQRACTIGKTQRQADRIESVVRCQGDGFVVLAERWDPGWSATVDDKPAPLVRTYGLVLGVPVPQGKHRLVVRYAPPWFSAGALASALVAVLLGAGVVHQFWRDRMVRAETPQVPAPDLRRRSGA
jgi:hypothetical protein